MTRIRISAELILVGLALGVLFRALLLLGYAEYFEGLTLPQIGYAFLVGTKFDLSIILLLLSPVLLLLNLPIPLANSRWWIISLRWFGYGTLGLMAILLIADHIYFEHVKRHLGNEIWVIGNDFGLVAEMALTSHALISALSLLAIAGVLVAVHKTSPARICRLSYTGQAFTLLLIITLMAIGIRGGISRGKPMGIVSAFETGDYRQGNLVLNGAFSALKARQTRDIHRQTPLPETTELARTQWGLFSETADYPFLKSAQSAPTGKNVVIVLLESWSYRYVDSLSGSKYGVTPNFDQIVSQGRVFERAYSVAQRSIDGIQGVLASTAPLPGLPTLGYGLEATRLKGIGALGQEMGYRTLFVQSSTRASFRMDSIAKAMGFAEYYGMEDMTRMLNYPESGFPRFGWDYETFMLLKSKINPAEPRPFLAFLFTGTTHVPYPYAGKQFEKYPHDPNKETGFLNTLLYADWALGQFMSWAKTQPWFNNTVFIFAADHPLGAYAIGKERHEALDDALRIPLVLYAPSTIQPERRDVVASQLDILPTVVDLIGYTGSFSTMGESLLSKNNSFALASEGPIIIGIDERCHIYHSIQRMVATNCQEKAPDLKALEQRVLLYDWLGFNSFKENRWVTDANQ